MKAKYILMYRHGASGIPADDLDRLRITGGICVLEVDTRVRLVVVEANESSLESLMKATDCWNVHPYAKTEPVFSANVQFRRIA
jgi:hypothetical protein